MIDPDLEKALRACESERIHEIGRIQPHGTLFLLDDALRIRCVSDNARPLESRGGIRDDMLESWLGFEAASLVARQLEGVDCNVPRIFPIRTDVEGVPDSAMARLLRTAQGVLLELEPMGTDVAGIEDTLREVRALFADLAASTDRTQQLARAAAAIRGLIGFDRALVYRFDRNDDGEVIAEDCGGSLPSLKHHHFPAGDLPAQVRRLYLRNRTRFIPDRDAPPVRLIARGDASSAPIDLTMSTLRAVAPIHVEYMANMGVRSSMSFGILNTVR